MRIRFSSLKWRKNIRHIIQFLLSVTLFLAASTAVNAEYIEVPAYPKSQAQVNDTVNFNHGNIDGVVNSLEFTYGFSDWLAGVVAFNSGGSVNQNYDYFTNADITAQLDLIKETDALPGTALRLTYSPASGEEPGVLSTMGVFEKKIGKIDNFFNIAIGKTVGDNAVRGAEFGVAAQTMYGLNNYTDNDEWAAGVEYFGDFGKTGALQGLPQKGQQAGPIISFQPYENLQTSLNYLVGLTHDQPRSTITFEINLTF